MIKIHCPQVDAVVECDCSDKCDAYKVRIKTEISKILQSAINGSNEYYRTDKGFIRWGLVEREIHETIDR